MRMRRFLIPVLCLLLVSISVPTPAVADYDAGMAAYERGDFTTAMTEWRPLAEAGDPEAQYRVGGLYVFGEGTHRDYEIGVDWF